MKFSTNPTAFRLLAGISASIIAFSMSACEVKKTQEGEMPEVKVEGGQVPKYDVETPDVKVEEKTVTVPDIDVVTPAEKRAGGNVEPGDPGAAPAPAPAPAEPAPAPAPAPAE